MDNAPDLLRVLVEALALVATSLDRWFQIPWPLVLAVFFAPVVAALNVGIWYLRGMTFPITCGYVTVRGRSSLSPHDAGRMAQMLVPQAATAAQNG